MLRIKLLISPPESAFPKVFLILINSNSIDLIAKVNIILGIHFWFLNSISPVYTRSEIQIFIYSLYALYVLAHGHLTFFPVFTPATISGCFTLIPDKSPTGGISSVEDSSPRFHLVHFLNSFMFLLKHHFPRPISDPCLFLLFYFCRGAYYMTTYHSILNMWSSPICAS